MVARVFILDYAVEGCPTPRLGCSSVGKWQHLEVDAFRDLISGQDDLGLPLLEVVASGGIAVGGELIVAADLQYKRPIVGVAGTSGAKEQRTAGHEPDPPSPHTRTIPNEVALVCSAHQKANLHLGLCTGSRFVRARLDINADTINPTCSAGVITEMGS